VDVASGAGAVIAIAGKESSDADDPHDHSVAEAIVRLGAAEAMKAIVEAVAGQPAIGRARRGARLAHVSDA
jgi:hypothetical protein